MSESKIEWTERTWNPVRGCSKISAGCENCYAMHVAARFSGPGQAYQGLAKRDPVNWTGKIELIEAKLYEPLRRRQPTVYFVNSMSDLFHESLPFDLIDRVFAVMALCPQHTFQVLTKRADRMREYFAAQADMEGWTRDALVEGIAQSIYHERTGEDSSMWLAVHWPLPNVWLGVSCENQATADERIPHLLATPAAVRFLSCEPLLEGLYLRSGIYGMPLSGEIRGTSLDGIQWVIVGGESGSKPRPCDVAWVRSIVEQCRGAAVACFVKQLGAHAISNAMADHIGRVKHGDSLGSAPMSSTPWRMWLEDHKGGDPSEWPEDLRVREYPRVARLAAV